MQSRPAGFVLATERLVVRRFTADDAPFVLELVGQPAFLRFIGDKGARDLEGARAYLRAGPLASYELHGFGLFHVALAVSGEPLGMCGLLRRAGLDDVEVGFAFLEGHWGHGFALEAARAVLEYGRAGHGLERIVAVTHPQNERSAHLLERLGLRLERAVELEGAAGTSHLYVPAEA